MWCHWFLSLNVCVYFCWGAIFVFYQSPTAPVSKKESTTSKSQLNRRINDWPCCDASNQPPLLERQKLIAATLRAPKNVYIVEALLINTLSLCELNSCHEQLTSDHKIKYFHRNTLISWKMVFHYVTRCLYIWAKCILQDIFLNALQYILSVNEVNVIETLFRNN